MKIRSGNSTMWRLLAGACAMGLLLAQAARAEEDQESPRPSRGWFSLNTLDALLELRGEYDRARVRTESSRPFEPAARQKSREWRMEESLGLKFDAALFSPGTLNLAGEISLGLTQADYYENLDGFTRSDYDNGSLLRYNLRADFFSSSPLSGGVYALRDDDRISRRFQPTLDQERTGFGTSWSLATEKVTMALTYDFLKTDRSGNLDRRDDERYTDSRFHYGADFRLSDRHTLRLGYDHDDIRQEYQGLSNTFETTRDQLTVEDTLAFGPDGQHELKTGLRWQEESGDFARDLFQIGPQLTLRHTDSLQTSYKYQYNRERYEGQDVHTQRFDFQLVHQAYTNLTTTFNAFGLYENIVDDVNTRQYGTSIDWQYNRRNSLGHFYADLGLGYDTEDVKGDNGRRIILDEAVTFRDPVPVTLSQRDVIPTTVIVTDASNRRVLLPGVDYIITTVGNATQLQRVRTGQIQNGDTVLVDYQVATPADGKIDTIRVHFGVEQRFTGGFTPYYRLNYRNQEDDPSTGFPRTADRTNHHRLGARYEQDRYSFRAEYEIFDDTVEPYHGFHLDGRVSFVQQPDHSLQMATRLTRLFFKGGSDDRNVTLVDVELDHRQRLAERVHVFQRLAYRWEDDSLDGITQGWDAAAGIEYVWGDLTGEFTIEYDRLDLPRSTDDSIGAFVKLRREIPNVLARR